MCARVVERSRTDKLSFLTDRVSQSYRLLMARAIQKAHFKELVECATRVFTHFRFWSPGKNV